MRTGRDQVRQSDFSTYAVLLLAYYINQFGRHADNIGLDLNATSHLFKRGFKVISMQKDAHLFYFIFLRNY